MSRYSVNDVAKWSGVTARTLHYYDKIGLLNPLDRTEAGYRYYGQQELLRLQQILFYKELDFSLEEIKNILDEPDFDLIEALESHRIALKAKRKRISQLVATINNTIDHLKNAKTMSNPKELYEGLPKEYGTDYREEIAEKYGKDVLEQSEQELMALGKDDFAKLQQDFEALNTNLFEHREENPSSEKVQELIGRHYQMIRQFWGTTKKKDPQADAYAGLGQLYVHDERYTSRDGQPQPAFAQFLKEAMRYFTDTKLK